MNRTLRSCSVTRLLANAEEVVLKLMYIEGFARQKTRDESDLQWKQFLSERDPHLIFDRLVLLRRDDGP